MDIITKDLLLNEDEGGDVADTPVEGDAVADAPVEGDAAADAPTETEGEKSDTDAS